MQLNRKLTIQRFQIEVLLFHILFHIQDFSIRRIRAKKLHKLPYTHVRHIRDQRSVKNWPKPNRHVIRDVRFMISTSDFGPLLSSMIFIMFPGKTRGWKRNSNRGYRTLGTLLKGSVSNSFENAISRVGLKVLDRLTEFETEPFEDLLLPVESWDPYHVTLKLLFDVDTHWFNRYIHFLIKLYQLI